jgi:hypothetical protein
MPRIASQIAMTSRTPQFLADLNVFLAAWILFISIGAFVLVVPVNLLGKFILPVRQAELWAFPVAYTLAAAALAYWWRTRGLSPRQRYPGREWRFRTGHAMLIAFNASILLVFLWSRIGFPVVSRPVGSPSLWASMSSLSPLLGLLGLVLVWGSRATQSDFEATVPSAVDQSGDRRSFRTPDDLASTSRAPSVIAVVLGLVASSTILYIAGVFASLAFQSDPKRFTGIVLPILGLLYVVYVAGSIALLQKRSSVAVLFAWAPLIALTVGLPVLQMILVVVRTVL